MIEVKNLTKRYGSHVAVDNISFTVNKGEILGFLGPNGAGKSTTMNIITGYLSPSLGSVSIAGFDVVDNPEQAKKQVGFLPEQPPLYIDMTVREYLHFVFDLKKAAFPRKAHIDEICGMVGISDVADRLIRNLSKGYRQRVGIAQALIGNPDVLILDEPTVGLDPKQIIDIRNLIRQLGKKHTVILSSHILPEVQAVCERIIVINNGKIIADGTPSQLSAAVSGKLNLLARIIGPQSEVQKQIQGIKGVKSVFTSGVRESGSFEYVIEPAPGAPDIRRALFERLATRNWPLILLKSNELTLEEIFLKLTSGDFNPTQFLGSPEPPTTE